MADIASLYTEDEKFSEIVDKARKNDEKSLSELCEISYRKVLPYVFHKVGQQEDAEDLTAEIIMKMVKSLKDQRGNYRTWLYRIAKNTVIDYYRKNSRRKEMSLDQLGAELPDRKHAVSDIQRKDKLKEAMSSLTKDQNEVITLRFLLENSIEETAKIMSKSIGAVKILQYRALHELRKYFKKAGYEIKD